MSSIFSNQRIVAVATALLGLCSAGIANAQSSATAPDLDLGETTVTYSADRSRLHFNIGTGFGLFQDLQVPVNKEVGLRGDGSKAAEENADHLGMLIRAASRYEFRDGPAAIDLSMDLARIRSFLGPAATAGSTYSQFNLRLDAMHRWAAAPGHMMAGPMVAVRESRFLNVSSGHYVSSVMFGVAGGMELSHEFSMRLHLAASPWSEFGYKKGELFGGQAFAEGDSFVLDAGLRAFYQVTREGGIFVDMSHEALDATIKDIREYNEFGLGVSPTALESREYDMSTSMLSLGFEKFF